MCGISTYCKTTVSLRPVLSSRQVVHCGRGHLTLLLRLVLQSLVKTPLLCSIAWKILFINILFTINFANAKPSKTSISASSPIGELHKKVPTGGVLHVFPRYGYFFLSMRVVPRNDSQSWVFLEPVRDVFRRSTLRIEEKTFTAPDDSLAIHNEFHIDLCDDMNQLVQAYFRKFKIQGLDKPWQAFAGGWRTPSLSKYFGIDPTFVVGDYRYMLVRVLMVRNSGMAMPLHNISANSEFSRKTEHFDSEDDRSMYNFANTVGTHYIHSYISGNAIYQVFVYDAAGFEAVKHRLSEFNRQKSSSYMSQLPSLLPLWAKQIGNLFTLNSSPEVSVKVSNALMLETIKNVVVPNIFKLHDNARLVKDLEILLKNEPSGLLGIELKTIDVIFKDKLKKKVFVAALKQFMQLWEVNFK